MAGRANAAALMALTAVAAATAAVSLTAIDHVKDAAVAASLHGQPIGVATMVAALTPVDVVAALAAAAAVLWLAWLERRQRAVTGLLHTASDGEAFVLLTILVAWFGHAYLNPGVLLGGDTGTHISRFLEVARGLDEGRLAQWTNYQYAGAPLLWFTGPLTYVVGGAIAFALHDAVLATKILLFTLHVLSGWLYFAFLRRLGIRAIPAVLVAAGFAGSFAHLHLFLYRGVVPQALTIMCLVALFYAADGLLRGKGARWANFLTFALATAAMIVNHQPHALFAAVYLGVFGAGALLLRFWHWRGLPTLVAAGVLGAVMSMIAVAPVLVEADWVMIEPEGFFRLHLPTGARLLNLLLWRNTRTTWGIDYWAYLGIGVLLFGAVGAIALARKRLAGDQAAIAVTSLACLAVCMVLYNPVVRDVIFVLFFAGLLAGIGFDWLLDRPVLSGRRLLLAAAIVVADLASTSVQPVARTDKGFLIDAGRMLERTAPGKRLVQLGVDGNGGFDADMGPDGGPVSYYSTVQRIAGNHNMAATHVHNYLTSAAKLVEADLRRTGALSPQTLALMRLFNVGEVICTSPVANGCPASVRDTTDDPVLGRYIAVQGTPVLFSQSLVRLDPPEQLEKPMFWPGDYESSSPSRPRVEAVEAALQQFLAAERPDPAAPTVAAIAVRQAVPAASGRDQWHPALQAYTVGLDRIEIEVTADAPGYVQLAHPWFPSTTVTVNGVAVQPLRGSIDLMVVPIAAGVSVIALQEGATWVRTVSADISLLALLTTLAAAAMLAWRDRAVVQRAQVAPHPL